MWSEHDLQELLEYKPGQPVLSAYLDLNPSAGSPDAHKLELRQLLRNLEPEAPEDVGAVLRFVEHLHDGTGRGLAIFSCAADDYFKPLKLAVPIRSRARLLDRPYVKPLADILNTYGHFGVALVDKQRARFLHFHLGELQGGEEFDGEEVRHTKRGGGSQAPGRRGGTAGQTGYAEEVAERNLRDAAQAAARFFQDHKVRRVFLGGTEANVARLTQNLPKSWQRLVVGAFPVEMAAQPHAVLNKALAVAKEAESARERKLVEAVVTAAAKGQDGVIRLDDTLEAVHAGRVQTLVVSEGYRQRGYRCRGCGYLIIQELVVCPFCGSSFEQIEDAVELAVRKVMSDGGDVEFVRHSERLEQAGRIGGLLRY